MLTLEDIQQSDEDNLGWVQPFRNNTLEAKLQILDEYQSAGDELWYELMHQETCAQVGGGC